MRFNGKILLTILLLLAATGLYGRSLSKSDQTARADRLGASPAYCIAEHNVGRMVLSVTNNGTFGKSYSLAGGYDCFTGEEVQSCEYPRNSNTMYLYGGAFWIGAVVGTDTLVSVGHDGWQSDQELHPDEAPGGNIIYRSTIDPDSPAYEGAVSEQDYIATYTDTSTYIGIVPNEDYIDHRPHQPLGIEVTQRSYAWSNTFTEDFVLFDYSISNIGTSTLNEVYMGIYVDGDVHHQSQTTDGALDDICGFRRTLPVEYFPSSCPEDSAVVNLAWIADNSGDLPPVQTEYPSVPHITATRLLRTPGEETEVSFNWWVGNVDPLYDFGPQTRENCRDLGTEGMGTPEGDRNKYFFMRNGEHDYDQVRVASIGSLDPVWLPPNAMIQDDLHDGYDTRYLLSFGPFDIEPGMILPISFAYIAGEDFHTDPNNIDNLIAGDWEAFYDGVDFSDLGQNAVWADWVYDNPGVDTDSDGYCGEYKVCGDDTVWISGDGVPDFRASVAPPSPTVWVEERQNSVRVRWNGAACECSRDMLSGEEDFEGYNAYLATQPSVASFARIAGYDVEDFCRYYWDQSLSDWVLEHRRFTLDELRCRYAPSGCDDLTWHANVYDRAHPLILATYPDSVFYFKQIGANTARFGIETPFVKRYPDAPKPGCSSASEVPADSVDDYLTEDGYFKYYEYEYTIPDLLPGTDYWVAITAFDYGSWLVEGQSMESPILRHMHHCVPRSDCCVGDVGNMDCSDDQRPNMGDLTVLIDHLFISLTPLCCEPEGNIDLIDEVDSGDLNMLIDHLFISLNPLPACP